MKNKNSDLEKRLDRLEKNKQETLAELARFKADFLEKIEKFESKLGITKASEN